MGALADRTKTRFGQFRPYLLWLAVPFGIISVMAFTTPDLSGNATQKSTYVVNKFSVNCFADDTGLEIEALNNEPGVLSARYAGEQKNFEE